MSSGILQAQSHHEADTAGFGATRSQPEPPRQLRSTSQLHGLSVSLARISRASQAVVEHHTNVFPPPRNQDRLNARGFWQQLQGEVPDWVHPRPGTNSGPSKNATWGGRIEAATATPHTEAGGVKFLLQDACQQTPVQYRHILTRSKAIEVVGTLGVIANAPMRNAPVQKQNSASQFPTPSCAQRLPKTRKCETFCHAQRI